MTTPAEAHRRFTQLDDDVHEIYEILKPIGKTQQRHGRALTSLSNTVATLDGKVDQLSERLDGVQDELNHIGGTQLRQSVRLDQLDRNLMGVNERLDAVDGRFERVEDRLTIVEEKLDRQDGVLAQHGAKLDEHGAKLDEHGVKLDQQGAKLNEHGVKLDQILDLLRSGRAETR